MPKVNDGLPAGIVRVIVLLDVPILVLPLYVVSVRVHDKLDPVVFCDANDVGGVQVRFPVVFAEPIVPVAEPTL